MTLSRESPTALFEKAWNLYESIALGNHMSHREIYTILTGRLQQLHGSGGYSMLDLGCGDARFLEPCFSASRPASYHGVDLSEPALELARKRMVHLARADWSRQDLLEHLRQGGEAYDVIFSGYALHHLATPAKREVMLCAARGLRPGGRLLLVDVIRRQGQSREAYIAAYLDRIRNAWSGLTPEMVSEACAHVSAFDFPETFEELDAMASQAGFQPGILHAEFGPHALMEFTPDPTRLHPR